MDHFKQLSSFVEVASRGSLSAAARAEGVAPAMIGRRLDALEQRLGVKLLQRSTRVMALTQEGQVFLEDCQRILADLQIAEDAISERSLHAKGHLTISAPAGFGRMHVAPLLPAFLAQHQDLSISLALNDRVIDLIADGVDVAIRIAALQDSNLVGVKLADNQRVVVAAPSYLQQHGTPQSPAELTQHNCLSFSADASQRGWTFSIAGKLQTVKVNGNLVCNDGAVLHEWAMAGQGLAWRSMWEVSAALEQGKLVRVLDQFQAPGNDIYAVYAQRRHQPLRIRVLIDYLKACYQIPLYRSTQVQASK